MHRATSSAARSPGPGNLISANHSDGVHIVGVGATRNLVEANYIGAAPGGGFVFGNGQPGNLADGVRVDDAPDNQIGGPVVLRRQRDFVQSTAMASTITGADGDRQHRRRTTSSA